MLINLIKKLFSSTPKGKTIEESFPKEYKFLQANKISNEFHHPNTYLLVKGDEKMGVYDTAEEALVDAFKRFKIGTFLIADSSVTVYISIKAELFQSNK